MIPLGLAELGTTPIAVGARLIERSAGKIELADALGALTATDAAPPVPPEEACEPGDFVSATVLLDPATGLPACTSLRRVGRGRPLHKPRTGRPLLLRQALDTALRDYFRSERFLEVHTPTFGPCPGLDPHVHALGSAQGVHGIEHSMTSPEFYMKRLLAEGVPRCFQLARVFRAEELGRWHEPEFTLLEWYRAYEGLEAVMSDTEQLVQQAQEVVRALHDGGAPSPLDLQVPFPRLPVRDAFRRYAGIADSHDYAASDPAAYFQTFVDLVEPRLAKLPHPVFLTEFPAAQAALARLSANDPSVALRFELLIGGVEICNGYDELTDAAEQRIRFSRELERRRAAGEPVYPLDERFLDALEAGMPPAAGNALGVERLLAVLTGATSIAPFYAFPASEH